MAGSGPRPDDLTSDALFHLYQELVDGEHPADAAGDVLQGKHVEILSIHAGDAIGDHHHGEISIQGGKGGVEDTGVGVDPSQEYSLHPEDAQQMFEVGVREAVEAFLIVHNVVVPLVVERWNDLRQVAPLDVV